MDTPTRTTRRTRTRRDETRFPVPALLGTAVALTPGLLRSHGGKGRRACSTYVRTRAMISHLRSVPSKMCQRARLTPPPPYFAPPPVVVTRAPTIEHYLPELEGDLGRGHPADSPHLGQAAREGVLVLASVTVPFNVLFALCRSAWPPLPLPSFYSVCTGKSFFLHTSVYCLSSPWTLFYYYLFLLPYSALLRLCCVTYCAVP